MLIGSGKRLRQIRNDPIIKIRDHILKRVYKKTVVGLEIDDKLQWTKHVDKQNFLFYSYVTKSEALRTSSNTTDDVQVICTPLFQLLFNYMV